MDVDPELQAEPANLKFLRRLVTTLTATMIVGLVVLIGLVVIRFNGTQPTLALPDEITLPDGETATAFTQGPDWYAIVANSNRILIFDRVTGALRQEIAITSRP